MSVIFQLFCAEDLKRLTTEQLKGLSDVVGTELRKRIPEPPGVWLYEKPPLALSLMVSDRTDLPPEPPDEVNEALKKRFREVSHQMESPQLQPSQSGFSFRDLRDARRSEDKKEQEELILQWAITCEVENYRFYLPLLYAKKVAYDYFDAAIRENMRRDNQKLPPRNKKILPIGPDSPYSPFNRRHPLYSLFYSLET
jgi:hypothetical protein